VLPLGRPILKVRLPDPSAFLPVWPPLNLLVFVQNFRVLRDF
jgi:hypothetical protein